MHGTMNIKKITDILRVVSKVLCPCADITSPALPLFNEGIKMK